jgi:hypothetical protein
VEQRDAEWHGEAHTHTYTHTHTRTHACTHIHAHTHIHTHTHTYTHTHTHTHTHPQKTDVSFFTIRVRLNKPTDPTPHHTSFAVNLICEQRILIISFAELSLCARVVSNIGLDTTQMTANKHH